MRKARHICSAPGMRRSLECQTGESHERSRLQTSRETDIRLRLRVLIIKGDRERVKQKYRQGVKTLYKEMLKPPFRVGERLVPTSTPCILCTARSAVAKLLLAYRGHYSSYKSDAKLARQPKIDIWRKLCRLDKRVAEPRSIQRGNLQSACL